MESLIIVLKLVVALGILNVWIVRRIQVTPYRGKDAQTLREEFAAYGLPGWVYSAVGVVKIALALTLLGSIWVPALALPASLILAGIMAVALVVRIRIQDRPCLMIPAAGYLALNAYLCFAGF